MTTYLFLQHQLYLFKKELLSTIQEAEDLREHETSAAVRIQKHWRGYIVRRNIARLDAQVLLIQRTFRGFLGRERARAKRRELNESLRILYFDRAATEIQRHWRGYVVRQRVLDFYQRKQFIQGILEQNRRVRQEAEAEQDEVSHRIALETDRKEQVTLTGTLSKLHYMLSTRQREGPLQAPMLGSLGLEPMASISGRPVEAVVRDTAKLRRQGTSVLPDGQPLPPLSAPPVPSKAALKHTAQPKGSAMYRQTIRSSEAYGEPQQLAYIEHRARQRAIAEMHGRDFVVQTGRVNPTASSASGSTLRFPPLQPVKEPYRDPVNYVMKGTRTIDPTKQISPATFKTSIRTPGVFDESLIA